MLFCRGNPLFGRLRARTTSTKAAVLASSTQVETASGFSPTNLPGRIEPYEINQVAIFYVNFMEFVLWSQKYV